MQLEIELSGQVDANRLPPIAHARGEDSQFHGDEEAQRKQRQGYQCKKQEEIKGKGRCKCFRNKGARDNWKSTTLVITFQRLFRILASTILRKKSGMEKSEILSVEVPW